MAPDVVVPSLPDVADRLARLEERVTSLEAAAGREAARVAELAENEVVRSDELAKVAWAVAHGRKRPW
jgi:hypothetical protein